MFERILQAFLVRHGLDEAMLPALRVLVNECIRSSAQVLPPEQRARLLEEASWQPIYLMAEEATTDPIGASTIEFPPEYIPQVQHEEPSPHDSLPYYTHEESTYNNHTMHPMNEGKTAEWELYPEDQEVYLSTRIVQYTQQAKIAEGGIGTIWRVLDPELNRHTAMKLLKEPYSREPEILSRFITEAQITAQLEHPGIVPVYEFGRLADGQFYYTMKEVKGQTMYEAICSLHQSMQGEGWPTSPEGWTLKKLLRVLQRVCEAMAYAHSLHVIHRDLKPDNIILGQHGEVMVLDWGLAKVLPPSEDEGSPQSPVTRVTEHISRHATQPGDILGTPSYMAPEQMITPQQVNERSDVYALGAILYELLAGVPPFQGNSAEAILYEMMLGPPLPPGQSGDPDESSDSWQDPKSKSLPHLTSYPPLPAGLMTICAKAMNRSARARYANAGELAQALDQWLEG